MKHSAEHDQYIAKAPEFAVPILEKLRKAVHKACPGVEETMKWSAPHYEQNGILAGVAAFKRHVRFTFWRGKHLEDPEGLLEVLGSSDMAAFTVEQVSELPPQRVLVSYLEQAAMLNSADARPEPAKRAKKKAAGKRTIEAPADLKRALAKCKPAQKTFDAFSYSNRKEYVEWIEEAKREATREKRIATAIEFMREGKPRNWKYMKEWR